MAYNAYIALPNEESIGAPQVAKSLVDYAIGAGVTQTSTGTEKVELSWDGWALRVWITTDATLVNEMCEAIKKLVQDHPNAGIFERATTILQVAADDDPDMEHFTDYLITIEQLLARLPGSVGIDVAGGEFFGS